MELEHFIISRMCDVGKGMGRKRTGVGDVC